MPRYQAAPTTNQINARNFVVITNGEVATAESNGWGAWWWDGWTFVPRYPNIPSGIVKYSNVNWNTVKPPNGPPPPPTKYSINFNSEGGSTVTALTVSSGSSATLPSAPIYTNHTFSGWYTNVMGGTQANSPYTPTKSIILYAQWSLEEFTITFNANNGSGGMSPETNNVSTALTNNAFTRTGYTFAHWNTAADGSGTTYSNNASYPFTSSTTLYAIWTINTYSIT